ncbi:hypothetical protein [Limnobaculum xujianqingii]|uniref:hypothetical protein n=1 Tax=Limnobaculum xujianqingii TaxID=2738837 RepID=UPI00112E8D4C|nr:hypothetical protein [Limnobaculum xujianqingii]
MKKNVLVIYIIMTVIGIIGLFLILSKPEPQPAPVQVTANPVEPAQETITVAITLKDITANTVLNTDDFRLQTMKISQGSDEKRQYSIGTKSLTTSVVNTAVAEGALIPVSSLIEPDSPEYLAMFLQPGNVLYTFQLSQNDNYLFDNLKAGQGVDIYLAYGRKILNDGSEEIVSPSLSIEDTRLKPLLKDRRVLALRPAKVVDRNGVPVIESGSQLITELKDKDVKLLKGLEDKAKLIIFPASQKEHAINDKSILPDVEAMWPVSEDVILDTNSSGTETKQTVHELRG